MFYLNITNFWEKTVGLEAGVIPDTNITASSHIESNPPSASRLGSHVGWCPFNLPNAFLQVDLGAPYRVPVVATQGHFDGSYYVTRYAIQLSLDGTHWIEFERVEYSPDFKNKNFFSRIIDACNLINLLERFSLECRKLFAFTLVLNYYA